MSRMTLIWLRAAGLGLTLMSAAAFAQDPVRVRGTIEDVSGDVYSVRTRDNKLVRLKLAARGYARIGVVILSEHGTRYAAY